MATVNTNTLRISNAKAFRSSLSTNSYVFVGRQEPWESDATPPTPKNNYEDYIGTYNQMVSLNRIALTQVFHMIPRLNWTSGGVYDIYRHDYSDTKRSFSNAANLYNASWRVINTSNQVYACLGNNKNSASTVEPQNTGSEAFYTSDGYQWLWLYTLSSDELYQYSTNNFIPIIQTSAITRTPGEIYSAVIDVPGSNYTGSPAGIPNQLPYYFTEVSGDGEGAVARVSVDLGSISEIQIVRPGSGYTYANINFVSGNVYQSLGDLDNGINALNPLGDGTFRSTVILTPAGGFGSDLVTQLGGTRVGVFSSLNYDQYDFVEDMSFRQVGILQGASFDTVNPVTATAAYTAKVLAYGGAELFTIGETITQTNQNGLTAKGTVVGYSPVSGALKYIQDPEFHSDTDGNLYRFGGSDTIIGSTSGKAVTPDPEFSGNLDDVYLVNGYANPEIDHYTGSISYLTNISPLKRQPTQTEKIRIIIAY